jgi:hypothetical protein
MIDWYVEISEAAPENFKGDNYLNNVIKTASPCMNYFCKRLSEINDYKLEDIEVIFSEIIEELPIMRANIYGEEFVIKYNRWVDIKLTDTTKQIYRDIKLEKIFNKL